MAGWRRVQIAVHLFDKSKSKINRLGQNISRLTVPLEGLTLECQALKFSEALQASASVLEDENSAKLVLIDQFGVDEVTDDVFMKLVSAPACDFLFFLTSSTLYRFRDHPAIKQKIERPNDYYHVHRRVLDYYRELLPDPANYYLAPFSIKKGANIYGLIFGSRHPLGIDKFLEVAWKQDNINGEADYDIGRENMLPGQPTLFPTSSRKLSNFERDLEARLRAGQLLHEADVMKLCFTHGVLRRHSAPVLMKLRNEGIVEIAFRVPDVDRFREPRAIRMLR